jgi:L-lactate utilization protein LutC
MPFGMKNATNTFSKTMMEVFRAYLESFLKVFVDDLNVHNLNWEELLENLCHVLLRLREINLKFNPRKCEFAKTNLVFVGCVVSYDGI